MALKDAQNDQKRLKPDLDLINQGPKNKKKTKNS